MYLMKIPIINIFFKKYVHKISLNVSKEKMVNKQQKKKRK